MPAIGDVWEVGLWQRLYNQMILNTFALKIKVLGTLATENAVAGAILTPVAGNWCEDMVGDMTDMQSGDLVHVRRMATKVMPTPGPLFDILTNQPGDLSDPAGLTNTALAISRRGEATGRRKYGRVAIAGIPKLYAVSGKWDAFITGLATDVADRCIGDFGHVASGAVFEVGFYSSGYRKPPLIPLPQLFVKGLSTAIRSTTRVQRSRTVDVGI